MGEVTKITSEDAVWPKIRRILSQLKQKSEKLETDINDQTILIKSKIRNKTDKGVLLRLMKSLVSRFNMFSIPLLNTHFMKFFLFFRKIRNKKIKKKTQKMENAVLRNQDKEEENGKNKRSAI